MKNYLLSRRAFMKKTGLVTTCGAFLPPLISFTYSKNNVRNNQQSIVVSTDFISGGGDDINIVNYDPVTISYKPHNEGGGGWSQVWWYFMVDGLTPGKEIVLQLDRDEPRSSGISPQIFFSYDQKVWGLTDTGSPAVIDDRDFFLYKHFVRGSRVWFAYDLPYTPDHIDALLIPEIDKDPYAEVFELCKTKNNRSVNAFILNNGNTGSDRKYGICLQARTHAFESGASWVLHELTRWLLSNDPLAVSLRKCAQIYIIPIVDVDAVVEGRTGKYQKSIDHWIGWDEEPAFWPETHASKSLLTMMAKHNMVDLFIDFHGPGNSSHPYFIIPYDDLLPYEKQRQNRAKFFEVLNSKPMNELARQSQSMTQIHYSERSWDYTFINSSHEWVIMRTNEHTLAFTLEVNMNTPISTEDGYRSEAIVLGRAVSKYFTNDYHQK